MMRIPTAVTRTYRPSTAHRLVYTLSLGLLASACTKTDHNPPPLVEPKPVESGAGGAVSSGEKQPEESPAEAKNPAEPKRGTLVVTRQKLMASGLSAGVREQIFKTPSDFRLELTSDPPVLTTETELSPFTQDESLWAIRIPPQKESLSLTVRLVQTKTKIPHLTSKVVVDTASPEPEYRWVLDWQQTAPQPGVTPGSTPKVSPLQKWDGLRDENGRHWKTVTSIP